MINLADFVEFVTCGDFSVFSLFPASGMVLRLNQIAGEFRMKARPEYVWEKFFSAPATDVWRLWTEPRLFSSWYGPNVETFVHHMQVEKGGQALIEMKWADGASQFQKFDYRDVQPGEKLVWLQSLTDSNWQSVKIEGWPQYLLTTVDIHQEAGKNCLHFTWSPYGDVSDKEIEGFKSARVDMDNAWKSSLALFDEALKSLAYPA